ncbi:MAG: biotin--[acetyl-CoA-carboxylase] ligase [Collinsella aerofaciens]
MDAKLTIVDVTGSTNDDLLEAGKQGAPHGTGLAARAQTAGRGRRGHKWDSTAGNLLLSIVLRPCVNPAKYSGLAAVSGLAVHAALEKQGLANEIDLKWPNDLVASGRKLGGILVEAAR